MDFDDNNEVWKCYEAIETTEKVKQFCEKEGIHFYMRSAPAIEYIRNK